jgi:hypothetical protein
MVQSTCDGTSRYGVLSCPATSPALRTQSPTVQTARLCKIIICIFRENNKKGVHYFTKMILKILNVAILAYFMSKF